MITVSKIEAVINNPVAVFVGLVKLAYLLILSGLISSVLCLSVAVINPGIAPYLLVRGLFAVTTGVFLFTIIVGALVPPRRVDWLFSKGSGRFFKWATVVVISMMVLFYSVEKWHGKRMWSGVLTQMASRGEIPGVSLVTPASVPEEQDMAKAAIFAPLSDYDMGPDGAIRWRDQAGYKRLNAMGGFIKTSPADEMWWLNQEPVDLKKAAKLLEKAEKLASGTAVQDSESPAEVRVMRALGKYSEDFAAIRTASQRPYARFTTRYDLWLTGSPSHQGVVHNLIKVLAFRAAAEQRSGLSVEAFEDTRCALRLASLEYQMASPTFWDSAALLTVSALQPVWEGLAAGHWTTEQVCILQAELEKIHPLTQAEPWAKTWAWAFMELMDRLVPVRTTANSGVLPFHGEDAELLWGAIRLAYPKGWSYQDQANIYWELRRVTEAVDVSGGRVFQERVPAEAQLRSADPFFAILIMPRITELSRQVVLFSALAQRGVNLARVACALERYRLEQGNYPETLDALRQNRLTAIPSDVMTGEPLGYTLNAGGKFTLRSIGWISKDEKEAPAGARGEPQHNDWVWGYDADNIQESPDRAAPTTAR